MVFLNVAVVGFDTIEYCFILFDMVIFLVEYQTMDHDKLFLILSLLIIFEVARCQRLFVQFFGVFGVDFTIFHSFVDHF